MPIKYSSTRAWGEFHLCMSLALEPEVETSKRLKDKFRNYIFKMFLLFYIWNMLASAIYVMGLPLLKLILYIIFYLIEISKYKVGKSSL